MCHDLKKIYFTLLLPCILGFALAGWAKAYSFIKIDSADFFAIAGPFAFILAVISALAFPVFYRSLFAHKNRNLTRINEKDLLEFERTLMNVAMITPYLALTAFLLDLPRFYTAGTILMGIYAGYYFYPSKRRIAFDRRIFRAT
jgi:hypothetical protein